MSEKEVIVQLDASIKDFNKSMGQVRKTLTGIERNTKQTADTLTGTFKKVGMIIKGALAFDLAKDFTVGIVKASGEVLAMEAQFETVFKEIPDLAQEAVNGLSSELSIMPNLITPILSQMGAKYKGLGIDVQEALAMAERSTRLVADASAFYDKSLQDTTSALNSFINGNYEGGEVIGLFGKETQLASYASLQLKKDWESLDEAGKQIVRLSYAEFMQENAGATGMATKEAGQLAITVDNLKAGWQEFAGALGKPLLVAVLPAMELLTYVLAGAGRGLNAFYERLGQNSAISAFGESVTLLRDDIRGAFFGGSFSEAMAVLSEGFPQVLSQLSSALQATLGFDNLDSGALAVKLLDMINQSMTTMYSKYPEIVMAGTDFLVNFINGIFMALPQIATAIMGIADTWIANISTMIPIVIQSAQTILNALITGIVENLPIILQMAQTILENLLLAIGTNLPILLQAGVEILMALIDGFVQMLPTLIPVAIDLVLMILDTIVGMLPQIIESGIQLIEAFVEGLLAVLPIVVDAIVEIIDALQNWVYDNFPMIISMGVDLIVALAKGLLKALPHIVASIIVLIAKLVLTFIQNLPKMIAMGIQIVLSLIRGIIQIIPSLLSTGAELIGDLKGKFTEIDWASVGKNIIDGIIRGLRNFGGGLVREAKKLAESAFEGAKEFLGIASPSKLFRDEIGKWIPEGVSVGIERNADSVDDSVDNMLTNPLASGKRMLQRGVTVGGSDTKTGSTVNNFNFSEIVIREEADIEKIAKAITKEQDRQKRAGGRVAYGV